MDDGFDEVWDDDGYQPKLPVPTYPVPAVIPKEAEADDAEAGFYAGDPDDWADLDEDVRQRKREARRANEEDMREFVAMGIASKMLPVDLHYLVEDPLTGKPMTLPRFEKVFAREIETGGKVAHIRMRQALFGIGAKGRGGKGAGAQVKAIGLWLERLERETWAPPSKQVEITDNTEAAKAKVDAAVDDAKAFMEQMREMARRKPEPAPK